jgi:hypothetical protein
LSSPCSALPCWTAYELELLRLFRVEAVDIAAAVPPVAAASAHPLIEATEC